MALALLQTSPLLSYESTPNNPYEKKNEKCLKLIGNINLGITLFLWTCDDTFEGCLLTLEDPV